jgi:spermidine synthase
LQGLGPLYVALYRSVFHESTMLVTAAQFVLSFALILVPSGLMGATLPVVARCYGAGGRGFGDSLGLLYAVNTAGGAVGLIAMGFVLIELLGIRTSYLLTGALNVTAALLAWLAMARDETARVVVSKSTPAERASSSVRVVVQVASEIERSVLRPGTVYLLTFIFGFVSVGLQVLWIRLWSFISLHSMAIRPGSAPAEFSSTYVFSGIVLLFLFGIALGGAVVRCLPAEPRRVLQTLAGVQLLQAVWIVLSTIVEPTLYFDSFWTKLVEIGLIIFPATLVMGLTFPLLAHLHVRQSTRLGSDFGAYYLSNALGCALGSLTAGLVALPLLGTYRALLCLGLINLLVGAGLLAVRRVPGQAALPRLRSALAGLLVIALFALAGLTIFPSATARSDVLFEEDNAVAHTLVLKRGSNRLLVMNNHAQAGSTDYKTGFGAASMSIPVALLGRPPDDILIVAVGVGNSWVASQRYAASITAVDINPAVFRAMPMMHPASIAMALTSPKNETVVADGRNYLLLSDRTYDVINVDPGPPITQPGMVNLHTREFYELAKARLKPDGVLYMRLSNTVDNEIFYRMLVRSIAEVFPEVTLWSFENGIDVIAANWRFSTLTYRDDLIDGAISGQLDDWFLMGRPGVDQYVAGVDLVTDDRPRLEYYLLARLFGVWPDGTPHLTDVKATRQELQANRVPLASYLTEVRLD